MSQPEFDLNEVLAGREEFMESDRALTGSLRDFKDGRVERTDLLTAVISHQLSYNSYIGRILTALGLQKLTDHPE